MATTQTVSNTHTRLSLRLEGLDTSTTKDVHTADWYPTDPSIEVGQALFDIVNPITIHHARHTPWSDFSTYEYFERQNLTPDDVDTIENHIWSDTTPFATCLGQSQLISNDIRAALLRQPHLAPFVNAIKLVPDNDCATSDHEYHVLTALVFENFVIVADPVNHNSAFAMRLGESFQCQERFVWGRRDQTVFKYWSDDEGVRHLSWRVREGKDWKDADWVHTHRSALRHLGIPGAQERITTKENGHSVPPAKAAMCRTLLEDQPKHGWYTAVDSKFMIYTCQVLVAFQHRCLRLQMPNEDWLREGANADLFSRLKEAANFKTIDGATAELRVELGRTGACFGRITKGDIELMETTAVRLGMPAGEVIRMGKAVYRVWNQLKGEAEPRNWPEVPGSS